MVTGCFAAVAHDLPMMLQVGATDGGDHGRTNAAILMRERPARRLQTAHARFSQFNVESKPKVTRHYGSVDALGQLLRLKVTHAQKRAQMGERLLRYNEPPARG